MRLATIHKESKPQKMLRLPPVYPRGMEDGRTEGANMANSRLLPSWVAFQAMAGPLLPVVSGSFLLCSPLPGTLYHLQLLSDRNFVRALLVHLQPRSWFTCNLDLSSPATWIQSLTRVSISRKSREEITHIFLSRAGELYFHFPFSSQFLRF